MANTSLALNVVLLALVGYSSQAFAVGDPAAGRLLYIDQCQACHGNPGAGSPASVANNPAGLSLAISRQPSMRFLANVLSAQDREDITTYIGNPSAGTNSPPTLSYTPAASSPVLLSGAINAPGAAATALIAVSPANGAGTGASASARLNGCAIAGSGFVLGAADFSFVGTTTTPQSLSLSCVRAAATQTATLSCSETRNGAVVIRTWPLTCPAGSTDPVAPTVQYLPAAGTATAPAGTVFLAGNNPALGSPASSFIHVGPIGGAGGGPLATTTLSQCVTSGAAAAAFAGPQTTNLALLPQAAPSYVDVSCNRAAAVQTATLSCMESRGGAPVTQRSWTLSCPAANQITPQSGWWWNPSEGGRGFFIEMRNNTVFMGGFQYSEDGKPSWFVVQTPMQGLEFSGPMLMLEGGQSLVGAYRAPRFIASPGNVNVRFTSTTQAVMTWPGGTVSLSKMAVAHATDILPPQAGAPESGWWWFDKESGRGFAIEFQANQLMICGFMYDSAGRNIWYAINGPLSTPTRYESQWFEFGNGQAMGAPYRPAQIINDRVGSLKLDFTDKRNGTLTLPDGRVIPITRQLQ